MQPGKRALIFFYQRLHFCLTKLLGLEREAKIFSGEDTDLTGEILGVWSDQVIVHSNWEDFCFFIKGKILVFDISTFSPEYSLKNCKKKCMQMSLVAFGFAKMVVLYA